MIEIKTCPHPEGTIHGDLSMKLRDDIYAALGRYYDLTSLSEIDMRLIHSGALSSLTSILIHLESIIHLPKGVLETYISQYRDEVCDRS